MTNQNNSFCGKGLIKLQPLVEQEMISFPEHPVFILLNFEVSVNILKTIILICHTPAFIAI
jgi:hypothetical protein